MGTTLARLEWQPATVVGITQETDSAKTFRLRLQTGAPHLPGQHYVVRLRAPDGYTAMRSYSVGSEPDLFPVVAVTVERFPDGEVSTYLHDVVRVGDVLDVRGPIGRWFVWDGATPALLLGGGSGVVPLMSMFRHARNIGRSDLLRLVISVRSHESLYFASELVGPGVKVIYTRRNPPSTARPEGRMASADIVGLLDVRRTVFVCGSSAYADSATDLVIAAGVERSDIRVERFG